MMDSLIQNILFKMVIAELINEDNKDVYRFGLECLLLKTIHYLSYLFIGFVLHMTIPMLVSVTALMLLRSKTGGYHAKTRLRCYCLSCFTVLLICLFNKVIFPTWLFLLAIIITNLAVWCFTPAEHDNRPLEKSEKIKFRRQALLLLGTADVAMAITAIKDLDLSQWLLNGIFMAAILLVMQKCKKSYGLHIFLR